MEDVKNELLERYKVLPSLSSRLTEVEEQYKDMREKYRQVEQKLSSMQVRNISLLSPDTVYISDLEWGFPT